MLESNKYFNDYVSFVQNLLENHNQEIDRTIREKKKLLQHEITKHKDYEKYKEYYGQPLINPDYKLNSFYGYKESIKTEYFEHVTPVTTPTIFSMNFPNPPFPSKWKKIPYKNYTDKDTNISTKIYFQENQDGYDQINMSVPRWMYDILMEDCKFYLHLAHQDLEPEAGMTVATYEHLMKDLEIEQAISNENN